MDIEKYLDVKPEVKEALLEGRPVVALESTILSHGMPYPENLDYLREHYKLAYNTDRFIVDYDAFASNLMPTITVRERGGKDL